MGCVYIQDEDAGRLRWLAVPLETSDDLGYDDAEGKRAAPLHQRPGCLNLPPCYCAAGRPRDTRDGGTGAERTSGIRVSAWEAAEDESGCEAWVRSEP